MKTVYEDRLVHTRKDKNGYDKKRKKSKKKYLFIY